MALSMRERKAITGELAKQYRKATKRQKSEILDNFVQLTGYNRSYAARALRDRARAPAKKKLSSGKVLAEDRRRKAINLGGRPRVYDRSVGKPLFKIWQILDCPCGKRLAPYLAEIVAVLERFDELELDAGVREKLLAISPATVDRLLAPVKREYRLKARTHTKPGTLLKHQIPIRTFSEWDQSQPGFVEIDLVAHDGGSASGEFMHTLDITDVCTGWTETRAVPTKAQTWVFEALKLVRGRLPFPLRGIDSDNGGEFINHHLVAFCEQHQITFTRGRPYNKNDSCYVEQKNYSVVRKTVGYARHDTEQELELINQIYDVLRLYTNYFQPVMKLVEKTRVGSRVNKRYDASRPPYHRALEHLGTREKAALKKRYEELNPAELKRQIDRMLKRLTQMTLKKGESQAQPASELEYV